MDNDAIDNQTLNLLFENNVTATFTMTAFESGRTLEIYGTVAKLRGGEFYKEIGSEIFIKHHEGKEIEMINLERFNQDDGYDHHMGGDDGLVKELYHFMTAEKITNSDFVHSHLLGFAAEEARITQRVIDIEQYRKDCSPF